MRRHAKLQPRGWAVLKCPALNEVFDSKFNFCPSVFAEWVGPHLDFSRSTILELGCGEGVMGLGITLNHKPARYIGVSLEPDFEELPRIAKENLGLERLPANMEFHTIREDEKLSERFQADCMFSWSVFEHVRRDLLDAVVSELMGVLRSGGLAYIQIAPLYYSPDGAHFFDLLTEPWAHLARQQSELRDIITSATVDSRERLLTKPKGGGPFRWEYFLELNRLTGDELIELFERQGFETVRQYRTHTDLRPPERLARIYSDEVLRNEQIVALFRRP